MMILFILFLGLIFGSFANMLSYRLPLDKPLVFDRSRCPRCNCELPLTSLIPVLSFFLQSRRCHSCKTPISLRYPLLELAMALLWGITYYIFGPHLDFLVACTFIFLTLILFMSDLETFILPISPMVGIGILGIYRLFYAGDNLSHLYGLAIGFSIFFLLKVFSKLVYKREAVGSGDVILSSVMGLFLGAHLTILYIYFSFLLGGFVGVSLLLITKKKGEDMIPFGPILVVAAYLSFFFGDKVWLFLGF